MLFVAIPKSSSSSLVKSLSEQHSLHDETIEFRRDYFAKLPVAEEYRSLRRIHSEMQNIDDIIVLHIKSNNKSLFKHHFPPTDHNQKKLKDVKKVILLRPPEEIIESYRRGDRTGAFPLKDMRFIFSFTRKGWLRKAKSIGLLDDLGKFYIGWQNHNGNKLIVNYSDVINNTLEVVQKIEEYFGLPVSSSISLEKERYSRDKISVKPLQMLNRRFYLIKSLLKEKIKKLF